MTNFMKKDNRFTINSNEGVDIIDELPIDTYSMSFDKNNGCYYLVPVEKYTIGKVYGNPTKHADRILKTFHSRSVATGVLLSGEKGCGKTMLAKMLSIKGHEQDIITIVINEPFCGEDFNKTISQIKQPAIIIFDEYEKVYEEHSHQEALLTLLDGVYPTKKLFVLTTNDSYAVNKHMINRPGRLFYNIEYKGLEESFIIEYCQDNLNNKTHLDSVLKVFRIFAKFNFDMMKAIVEEMNRFDEDAYQAIQIMNIKPEDNPGHYNITLTKNGENLKLEEESGHVDPMEKFAIYFYEKSKSKRTPKLAAITQEELEEEFLEQKSIYIRPTDILSVKGTTYTFKSGEYIATLKLDESHNVFDINERLLAG